MMLLAMVFASSARATVSDAATNRSQQFLAQDNTQRAGRDVALLSGSLELQVAVPESAPTARTLLKIDATVKPGDSPATNTIYATVKSQPGTHRVRIAAVASPVPKGRAANIRELINVTVR